MEIVNFGKQGFANRFCRELADSIANTWVWAPGFKPKACHIGQAHRQPKMTLELIYGADLIIIFLFVGGHGVRSKCSICSYRVGQQRGFPFRHLAQAAQIYSPSTLVGANRPATRGSSSI